MVTTLQKVWRLTQWAGSMDDRLEYLPGTKLTIKVTMIGLTVKELGRKLERLSRFNIPLQRCFDILSARAESVEEELILEVMRESYLEMAGNTPARGRKTGRQIASNVRSA